MRVDKKIIALTVILLLAATLRFYKLGVVPTSLNADESAIGYNAFSILKTGKDEYGRKFPLLFQSFDDFKMPVYVYLTVPGIAMFGLNDFSVRLPSAILGTLTVLLTYFLVTELFKHNGQETISNKQHDRLLFTAYCPILSSALLAISPWHLQFSRSAYEANIAVFFNVLGIMLLMKALKKSVLYIPAFLALALSVWSYHSSRVFVPMIVVGFFIIYYREILQNIKYVVIGLLLFIAICTPLLLLSISPEGLVRARGVSALGDVGPLNRTISWRQTDERLGIPLSAIFHNRRLADVSTILKGYLSHFDPNFFFSEIIQGKFHAPGVGLMYLWELPVLLYGLHIAAGMKGKGKYILFLWFLLAPVAASPTRNLPHPVRTLEFLPTLQIFVAIGLRELFTRSGFTKKIYRQMVINAGVGIILLSSLYYLHQYYVHGSVDYASDWQYGYAQIVKTVKTMKRNFSKVIVSTSLDVPYIFFLYYLRYDPATYLSEGGTRSGKFDEQKNAFDVYDFHSYMTSGNIAKPNILYVGTPKDVLPGMERLVEIKDPSGEVLYTIYGTISKLDWNKAGNLPYLD